MEEDNKEVGAFTGLDRDLPFGQHPFDWFLDFLMKTLGERKTKQFLGVIDD